MSDPDTPAGLDRVALAALQEMVGGDQEFLAEMIDTFLDDGPARLAEMEAASLAGDAAELRRAAHTLKSNCRTFGATALADRCQRIEDLANAGSLDDISALIASVAAGYPEVVAALEAERSGA
jgi:HPt (histidine-containing phosphotransfer) domain-containing protein